MHMARGRVSKTVEDLHGSSSTCTFTLSELVLLPLISYSVFIFTNKIAVIVWCCFPLL